MFPNSFDLRLNMQCLENDLTFQCYFITISNIDLLNIVNTYDLFSNVPLMLFI